MLQPYQAYPIINQLSAGEWQQLELEIKEQQYVSDQLIMMQGEVSECVHIILSGQARVFIENETKVELALLQRGHFFGEMSCLTGDPVSAFVEAVDYLTTITVSKTGMLLLMDKNADFRNQIIDAMIKRIQNSNERVLEEHTKSQLIMKQYETEDRERSGNLIGTNPAMKQLMGHIERLSAKQDHVILIGEAGTGKRSIARKLHYAATQGQYPMLTINGNDFDLLAWDTKIRAAKGGTLVVEHAEQLPADLLKQIVETAIQTRIVLTAAQPLHINNIASLYIPPLRERVEDIPLLAQYFVENAGADDAESAISSDALRLLSLFPYLTKNVGELQGIVTEAYIVSEGRTISSNHLRFGRARKAGDRPTIGLALGSGSVRGMAHLGILRVLEEEGIPIDMIAGTSVGSLVGGAYAAGMPVEDCVRVLSTIRWRQLVRPTIPKHSFVHNTPMIGFIEQHVGKRNIEDLPIPFAAVASDASTGEAHIMRNGLLAHAISASTAIPAIMRPVQYQGKTLVDGAVVHPVPAALVKSMGADIVIAANVCTESFSKGTAKHFVDSLLNTIDIMSAKMVKEELQLADIVLRPDLGHNQISFKDSQICIAAGEAVTRDAIMRIKKKLSS
ncbi:putative acylesterase/phospholipase RssA/CRP-like cAMP-binding protein [Paenibacillus castaneae]|uniref:patatin-like phospholipase family protein n=1 Tax=Paenibacillus castaneae TaxID=474957 RepID=UPI000C9A7E07|nr:patatin-like phospholipase family protein [Paenibacillus castaneae]NIK77784.1 putative acylesterase/phospholipase RssA/CRP-like cAMP-binding protein [Paenibacillus castaneae]